MARERPTPHIAWPLKLLAFGAVAAAVFAGVQEVRGGDDEDTLDRQGSEVVDGEALAVSPTARAFPRSYTITSRLSLVGARSGEVHRVVAPVEARTETYAGAEVEGPLLAEREVGFGILATRNRDANPTVLQAPPAVAGPRLAETLVSSERLGLVERREVRRVARRRCQVWRTSADLGATTFMAPTSGDAYLDLCVDGDGLLLEEWQVDGGRPVRQKVAVEVELDAVKARDVAKMSRDVTLPVSEGGGSVIKIGDGERPVGPFLDVPAAPEGFALQGRYTVVPPHPGLRQGGDRGKVRAATVDVFVRTTDVIVVERGGVLDLSDPWSVDERFPDVDLGPVIGVGEHIPGRLGGEVRALLGSGRYLRVFGTSSQEQLVEIARSLVPIDGGSGIGFED